MFFQIEILDSPTGCNLPVHDLASPKFRQSTKRESKGKCCNATQNQVETQDKALVTFFDHHSRWFTKTFANNWYNPYISGSCTPYSAHLKDNSHRADDKENECDVLLLSAMKPRIKR